MVLVFRIALGVEKRKPTIFFTIAPSDSSGSPLGQTTEDATMIGKTNKDLRDLKGNGEYSNPESTNNQKRQRKQGFAKQIHRCT